MEKYTNYLIKLLKSTILNTTPPPLPQDLDLNKLFQLSKSHAVENIAYIALNKLDIPKSDIMELFNKQYMYAVFAETKQQFYLNLVENCFEKNKIRYCVMKGSVIKKLYPSPDMRMSSDIDIFVHDEDTEKVKELMTGLGFKISSFNKIKAHDGYIIDGFIMFEIHRQLISDKCAWDKKCQQIENRLVLSDNKKYAYEMSKEDYYLYMIAHMAKHMKYKGIGIKMFLDVWIYLRHYESVIDKKVLTKRLKYCGLYTFDTNVRKLCKYWFEDDKTADMSIMAEYVSLSGTFGTNAQRISGEIATNTIGTNIKPIGILVSYVKMFFLPYKKMCIKYPILLKKPLLLPIMWIYRGFISAFVKKERRKKTAIKYDAADLKYGQQINKFKKSIGL